MASKMNLDSALGSRIAEVHNGSSLFTGDAGQGESNIRRWIIENDWLEAIVALPLNLFYNTGIATYVWVLTNKKPEHGKGKMQLIDARSGSSRYAKISEKRTVNFRPMTSGTPPERSSTSRKHPSPKYFPMMLSAIGKLLSSVRCACTASSRSSRSRRCALPQAMKTSVLRSTTSLVTTLFTSFAKISAALDKRLSEWGRRRG